MRTPIMHQYTRNHLIDTFRHQMLKAGDAVYYLSPLSKYAIRKSTITAIKELPCNHHIRPLGGYELTLADGTIMEYNDVFESKEKAMEYFIADLRSSLAYKRIALQTIQQEMKTEERMLKMFEDKMSNI